MKRTMKAALTGLTALMLAGTGVGVAMGVDRSAAQSTHHPTVAVTSVSKTRLHAQEVERQHASAQPTVQARTVQQTSTPHRTATRTTECAPDSRDHRAVTMTRTRMTQPEPTAAVHHTEDAHHPGDAHDSGTDH